MTQRPIAFVLPDMRVGGAERVALTLIKAFVAAGEPVDLVLQEAAGELLDELPAGVRVVDLGVRRLRNAVLPLSRYFRDAKPRSAQVSMWPLTVVAVVARTLSRARLRLILSDHTLLSMQYAAPGQFRALRASMRLFYSRADACVAVSQAVARDLADLSGMPEARVDIIYNPIPHPAPPAAEQARAAALWGNASPRILAVGRLKSEKNYPLLLRAFARFHGVTPGARLLILGEGPLEAEIRAEIERLGLTKHAVLPGHTSDLSSFYASADLFAMSSDFEGFGNVLVEALHWGLPVVSTDCPGGPREILSEGRFGLLVPPADEEALATGMTTALAKPVDKAALRERASALSGADSLRRYAELLGARL